MSQLSKLLKPHIISTATIVSILSSIYHRQWFLLQCVGFLLSLCIFSLFLLWAIFFIANTELGHDILNLLLLPTPETKLDDTDILTFWSSIFQNTTKKDIQHVIKALKMFKHTHKSVIHLCKMRLMPSSKKSDHKKKSGGNRRSISYPLKNDKNDPHEDDEDVPKESISKRTTKFATSMISAKIPLSQHGRTKSV